jgi:predicted anti-sigma-YlaC factor YlaD
MTGCNANALSLFLEGALPVDEHREVADHLRNCAGCRAEMASLHHVDSVIRAWAANRTPIPSCTESRIYRTVDRRRKLRPLLALSRMMPAALGTSVAALLVLVTANLAPLYRGGAQSPTTAHIVASKALKTQSAPLRFQRGKSASVDTYTAPLTPIVDRHIRLDVY